MLKPRTRELICNTFFVVCGVVLCAFILIPRISTLFVDLFFSASLEGFSGRAKLLGSSISMEAAFSVSGFLTALFVGYFSKNKEVRLTLYAVVLVAMYYSISITSMLLRVPDIPARFLFLRMFELSLHMISLIGFAALGAWLIKRKRRKVELNSDNPASGD